MRYGVARTEGGKRSQYERPASTHIPYTVHMDDNTVGLEDGSLLQVIKVKGFRFETQDFETLQHNVEAFNTLLRGQRRDTYLHTTWVRRIETAVPGGAFESDFSRELNSRWQKGFSSRDVYVNELYLSVVKMCPEMADGGLRNTMQTFLGRHMLNEYNEIREQMRLELSEVVQNFMKLMKDFGTRRLRLVFPSEGAEDTSVYCEVPRFLSKVLNQDDVPFALTATTLNTALPKRRLYFKHRTLVQEGVSSEDVTYSAMLSIKEYGKTTWSGIFNSLLSLPYELVVTQSFVPIPNEKARKSLEQLKGRLKVAGEHQYVLDDVDNAIGDLATGVVSYGDHHLSIMCTEKTPAALERAVSEINPVFTNVGVIMVREDRNLEPVFWAQLPGNIGYVARSSMVSTKNMAAFASFHNYAKGKLHNDHLGPALTVVPTPGDTPYFLNLHVGGLGNTCIFGNTTTGKTTFAAFLISQSQKYGGKTIVLDKDNSWEVYVRAENGAYVSFSPGTPSNLNPLRLPDTPDNRRYLTQFIGLILEQELKRELVRREKDRVQDAVNALYDEFLVEQRRFTIVQQHLIEPELREALTPWIEGQPNGWIFDNTKDSLSFESAVTGIDVGWLLKDNSARSPVMSYLLYRIQEVIDGEELARIIVEEGPLLMRDEAIQVVVDEWVRTVRKKNAFVMFLSQDPDVGSKAGRAIYEQSATKIFFPHFSADHDAYCNELGLTESQYKIIKESHTSERKVFIKHGDEAVVIVFDLSQLPEQLAVLAGTGETVRLMRKLRERHGEKSSDWLPYFYQEVTNDTT